MCELNAFTLLKGETPEAALNRAVDYYMIKGRVPFTDILYRVNMCLLEREMSGFKNTDQQRHDVQRMLQLATPVKPPFLIKIKQDLERHRLRRSAAQYLSHGLKPRDSYEKFIEAIQAKISAVHVAANASEAATKALKEGVQV
jgi:hypothetical protein